MKILLTGAKGRLGTELQKQDKKLFLPIGRANCDIIDQLECHIYFTHNYKRFNSIFHCAAYTDVAKAEIEKDKCHLINVIGTQNIVQQCNIFEKKLIFISTDYVFNGKNGNYKEDDKKNPINYYASTKSIAEDYIIENSNNYLIMRTSFKESKFPHEFVCIDMYTSADYIDIIASKILKSLKLNISGIYHIGAERKSLFDLIKQRNPSIKSIKRKQIKSVNLPYDVSLNCNKFNSIANKK